MNYKHILATHIELPEPQTPDEYHKVLPYLIAMDLDSGMSIRDISAKYKLSKLQIRDQYNRAQIAQSLLVRKGYSTRKKKLSSTTMAECMRPGCRNVAMSLKERKMYYCAYHEKRLNKVYNAMGSRKPENKWQLPDELRRELLKEIIKLGMQKNKKITASYFVDEIRDPGALAMEYELGNAAEAKAMIVEAGIALSQIIEALKKYVDKSFLKPKIYWATEVLDVVKKAKNNDMNCPLKWRDKDNSDSSMPTGL